MAKKTADDIIKKFNAIGSTTATTNKTQKKTASIDVFDKGKRSNSSASSSTTKKKTADDIIKEFNSKKSPTSIVSVKAPSITNSKNSTTKKYSDFNTETKNAYTSAKDKVTSKTTIKSKLSDDERNKRIKEINSELSSLKSKLSGYSRASAYGTSKAMQEAKKRDSDRIAELTQELKELERVGTFSASELKQFEIDDAKAKVSSARQKVNSYGARPSLESAESYKQANSELYNARQELDLLEQQKEFYDDITKFGDVVNKDNNQSSLVGDEYPEWIKKFDAKAQDFESQWRANYRSTDISEKSGIAFNNYLNNPTEENKNIAMAYKAFAEEYMKNNEKALDDEGQVLPLISDNLASHLAQTKGQMTKGIPLGVVGGLLGLGVDVASHGATGGKGAKTGWALGYSAGVGLHSYEVIRGSLFSELLSYGLDEETAKEIATDDALVESLIESGESVKDWTYMLVGGLKGGITSKASNKAASLAAKYAAHPIANLGWNIGKGTVLNAGTEYLEEGLQGAVSRASREKAWALLDKEIGQYGEGNIDLHNRPIYKNADGTISTVDSVTFTVDGKYVVLPTIVRDENENAKRLNTDEEIFAHYEKTGEYLGKFATLEEANGYANSLHYAQAYRYSDNTSTYADDNALIGGAKVVGDAVFGGNTEAREELHGQGVEGFKTGLISGGIHGTARFVISSYANSKTVEAQNEIADFIKGDEETLNALIEEGKASGEGTVSAKLAEEVEQAKEKGNVTREQVKKLIASNEVYIKAEQQSTTPDPLEQAAREMVAEKNRTSNPITADDVKKATGFGDSGAVLITKLMKDDGVSFESAKSAVETAYRAGLTGVDSRQVKFFNDTQRLAFEAGKNDKQIQDRVKQAKAQNAAVYNTGFTENEHSAKLTSAEREMFSTFANDFKMDVSMTDKIIAYYVNGKAREANAKHVNGKMEVSSTSELPMVAVAMHEVFHRMRQLDPVATDALMNFLYETSDQNVKRLKVGDTGVSNFERIKGEYSNVEGMEALDYIEEIACRRSETIFSSPEAYNEWRAKLEMNPQAKSDWQKLLDVIRKLIEDMWATITNSKMSIEAKRQAQKELELFADAYRGAMKAADTRLQAVEAQKKTEAQTETRSNVTESPVASENVSSNKETPTKPKNKPQVKKRAVKVGETYTANRTGKTYTITDRGKTHTTYTVTDKNGKTTTRKTTNTAADINFNRKGDEGFALLGVISEKVKGVKAGDVFTATGTTYKIVSRDAQNTKVEISSKEGTQTMLISNEIADRNFTNMSAEGITKWIDEDEHIDNRYWDEVGDRKVKAFQFLFPEMKEYYTPLANELLGDLDNTIQGERMKIGSYEMGNEEWIGIKRFTSEAIATIKDNNNATYEDIRNALNRLINDEGQENIALAKRIELVFDDMLTKGYTAFDGMQIPPNEEYITKKEALIGKKYEKHEPSEWDEDLPFFSLKKADEKAPAFYSHMGKTIDGIKQDKIGANSVVSYLTGRGVKAEEIKWSGIETFLEGKKSVSKAELQEFVAGSMLQIETKTLRGNYTIEYTENESKSLDELSKAEDELWEETTTLWEDTFNEDISFGVLLNENSINLLRRDLSKLRDEYGSTDAFNKIKNNLNRLATLELNRDNIVRTAEVRNRKEKGNIKAKYESYTLDNGSNYRELLFKLPNSEYTNDAMSTHWGEGGILAHARVQDFDVDGQKMLFIEEIQSDWHNEGAKKGYSDQHAKLKEKYETLNKKNKAERENLIEELTKHFEGKVADPVNSAKSLLTNIANDKSNFNSLIKKAGISTELTERILKYELAKVEEAISFQESLSAKKGVEDAPFRNNYHEYVLKNLLRMAAEEGYDSIGWTTADIQSKRWSEDYAEGYRIEYDQDIPKFLNKYGKKWGAKVGTSNVNGNEVWSMPITDSMKESVLYEGQPMFSLKKPVEETKNLIAVHNMQVSELERTLDLGGLPMPSIAVIKAQSGHSEYGDVSLVFSKETIDPKSNKDNKVYGGDAWTPTYPKIEYKPNAKIAKNISDKYYELSKTHGYEETKPLYNYVYDLEEQLNRNKGETGMLNELYDDTRLMQLYLLASGKDKVETINKETRTELSDEDVKFYEFFIKELGTDVVDAVMWDSNGTPMEHRKNYMSKYGDAIREAYKKLLSETYHFTEEQVQNTLNSTKTFDYLKFVRDAHNYRQNGRVTIKAEADYEATQNAIREAVGEDYHKWVDALFKGIEEKSGIRNNADYFTNNGNRRSWEALHWENNLENVVKVMKGNTDVGGGTFFSGHSIWGVAAKNYRSIEEIKADSDRLKQLPEEEYNQIKEGFGGRLTEIAHSIMDKSERNPFIASDNAMECIVESVRNSKTKSGILSNLKQYQHLTVTETTVDDIVSLVSDIANMPTEYFEAKPKRAVTLNEIATAIIPDKTSEATKARLSDMGIKYLEYESGNEQARLEALNSLEDVRFSLKNGVDVSPQKTTDYLNAVEGVQKGKKGAAERLAKYVDEGMIRTEAYDALIEKYGVIPSGERPHRDVQVPRKSGKNKKVSQTVRTILEAKATPDEAVPTIEKMVEDGIFSYDVYTDKAAIEDGENYIKTHGWEQSLIDWFEAVNSGEVSKEITTTGWILYNHAANKGDTKTAIMILDAMVRCQRSAAQALQATRILKKLSPETQLYGVQKSVQAFQNELTEKYGDKAPELKIDEELAEQFINAKTPEERAAIEEEIYKDIGRQMPSRFIDKWNAWRYLAMLGNPRTHVRNLFGNAFFAPVVGVKNLTATAIEEAVYRVSGKKTVRGKALVWGNKADRALLKAAWSDYGNVADMISNGGKYNDSAMANKNIQDGRRIFKFKPLEWARKKNSELLEREDILFSKPHYAYALAQYCKANNITAEQIKRGKAIAPARDYAIKEAQKATYRDTNAFSQMVSEWGRNNKSEKNVVKKAFNTVIEGILPFRKTPANILVRGVEYSPLGMLKGLSYDLYQVGKGKMTASEAIDNISAGLTGTGLLALGVYLAAQGLIRGHGEDEEEKEFKELMGHQSYSLELPNGQSITLDWLAPEALPFFVGVNIWETSKGSEEEINLSAILQSVSHISEPMLEMSCLQGLNDLFEGIGYASSNDTSGLVSVVSSAVTSYLTQGIPTLSGQAERTGEEERMSTYTEKNDFLTGDMQYTLGKMSAKIPFWDYNQIPYIDAWGRREASGTALKRGLNNFLNPAYTSTIETSDMENELLRLYEQTGEASVFPSRADKYFTVDSERKDLTADEYVRYATLKGEKSYKAVTDLVNSRAYQKLTDAEKVKAVEDAYDYANQKAKEAIGNYKPQSWVGKADGFANVGNYLAFKTEVASTKEAKGDNFSKQDVVDIMLDMAQNDSETWKLYLSEYDSKKDLAIHDAGIGAEEYMTVIQNVDKYDEPNKNGNLGTYTNDEIATAISATDGLTKKDKAILWQEMTGSKSTKNNPWRRYLP